MARNFSRRRPQQLLVALAFHFGQARGDLIGDGFDGFDRRAMGAAFRLRHDGVDQLELQQVLGGDLQRRGGLLRLVGAAPQDRGAAFRRDHRIDRMLQHIDAVGGGDGDGAARHAFADDGGDEGRLQRQPGLDRTRDGFGLAALLRR